MIAVGVEEILDKGQDLKKQQVSPHI